MSPGGGGLSSPLSLHCPVLAAASVCDWPVLVLSCSLSPSSERGGAQPSAQGAALTPPGYQPLGTGSGPDPWDPGPSAGRSLPSPAATSRAPATFHLRPCDPGQTRPGGTGLVPSPVGACPPTPLSLPSAWVVGCHRWENGRPCPAAPSSAPSPVLTPPSPHLLPCPLSPLPCPTPCPPPSPLPSRALRFPSGLCPLRCSLPLLSLLGLRQPPRQCLQDRGAPPPSEARGQDGPHTGSCGVPLDGSRDSGKGLLGEAGGGLAAAPPRSAAHRQGPAPRASGVHSAALGPRVPS